MKSSSQEDQEESKNSLRKEPRNNFAQVIVFTKTQIHFLRDFHGTFSVMEAMILYWMVSGEDVFYPSSGVCHFPLVRQKDAPFVVRFLIAPRPLRVWEDEVFDEDWLSDFDVSDSSDEDRDDRDDWGANPRY